MKNIKKKYKKLSVGLEIGTSKIVMLIGEILDDNTINIIGIGKSKSKGISNGNITDIQSISECIKDVINQAELMSNCKISSIYLSVSGKYLDFRNELGIIPILNNEITQEDINNVIYNAQLIKLNNEKKILHIIPQEYIVDDQREIKNPIGLSGVKLQVIVHLITCNNDVINNIIKIIEKCNIDVDNLIYSGLASSYSVLTDDEKELGVCMIDIGGGTIDIVIYINSLLKFIKVIPYAGNLITNDISYAFNISNEYADLIKLKYGSIKDFSYNQDEIIEISNFNGSIINKNINKKDLQNIIRLRYIELFSLINKEIVRLQEYLKFQGYEYDLLSGIVLTGGAIKIEGLINYAKNIFNNNVRIGFPTNLSGLNNKIQIPDYSTVFGLLNYSRNNLSNKNFSLKKKKSFLNKLFINFNNIFKKIF